MLPNTTDRRLYGTPRLLRVPGGSGMAVLMQAWRSAKLALITSILYVPTALAMMGVGWSSRRFEERRWHCSVPLLIAAAAFM